MSTIAVAIDALVEVAHDSFVAAGGALLPNIAHEKKWPFGEYNDTFPTIFYYPFTGSARNKGLGFVAQWRLPNVRVDLFANTNADVNTMFEQLRTALQTDFETFTAPYSTGLGYLRNTGRIKYLEIGEARATDWEEQNIVFRRTVDIAIVFGD